MTYLFKCHEAGDVLMLQPDGDAVLRIIGKAPAARGIIEAAALPAAIAAIEKAVAQEELPRARAAQAVDPEDAEATAAAEVTLRQRTWPVLQMLKAAHAASADVVWGV